MKTRCTTTEARSFYRKSNRRQSAFTLVEVLIATVIALLMLASLTAAFKRIGDAMTENRAALDLSNRLRGASFRLRKDLEGLTAQLKPPMDAREASGYFEYFEGPMTDYSAKFYVEAASVTGDGVVGRFGDFDDILMFTARSNDEWFTGKVPKYIAERNSNPTSAADFEPVIISSQYAEIVWFAMPVGVTAATPFGFDGDGNGVPDKVQLYRRVLLIRPDLNSSSGVLSASNFGSNAWMDATNFPAVFQQCDLSLRRVPKTNSVAANSLQDLMYRQNRFAHRQFPVTNDSNTMPLLDLVLAYPFTQPPGANFSSPIRAGRLNLDYLLADTVYGNRLGEDILLSDCVAFDIKGFDPDVPLANYGTASGAVGTTDVVLSPNDPGYAVAIANNSPIAGAGDYVDLGWGRTVIEHATSNSITLPGTANLWTELSGLKKQNNSAAFSDSLLRSGLVFVQPGRPLFDQMTYDTWTTGYEEDGFIQEDSSRVSPLWGTVVLDTNAVVSAIRKEADMGSNGIDDFGPRLSSGTGYATAGGVDDDDEKETSPPFPTPLRSLKATIRLEDPDTRQLQQMSITSEFLTH